MDCSSSSSIPNRKPQVILAACGCVCAVQFKVLCRSFLDWAEVRVVVTQSSLNFIDAISIPTAAFVFYDEHQLYTSKKNIGDCVLHIELCKWADFMVIAPLSANTLAKIAGGVCDNLLTNIVRSWDHEKPIFVAPSMNVFMWKNPLTEQQCKFIGELGVTIIPPLKQKTRSGDYECTGAMAEPETIHFTVKAEIRKRNVDWIL